MLNSITPNSTHNALTESKLPASVLALFPDQCVCVTLDEDTSEPELRRLCGLLGEMLRCHYEVRRTETFFGEQQFVIRRLQKRRICDRSKYAYSTLNVGEHFVVPAVLEPNEQNLRVYTSTMGKKFHFKLSVRYNAELAEYTIVRLA